MKRPVLWIVAASAITAVVMLALQAQERRAPAPTPEATLSPTAAQPGQSAFAFTDDEQMQQFAQLWAQRQGIVTRTAVLQAYWNQEQTALAQINQQLLSQFNLDVNKTYTLDTSRKVLIERGVSPEQPAQLGEAQAPEQPTPASSTNP